ncbi:unnamed protein product [Penicillium glandicola]
MTTVFNLLQSCLVQFNSLITSEGLDRHIQEVPLQAWRDELGRLRVWASNIADQTGESSLNYHLRDASHIKDQILSLLGRVKELLLDLTEVLEEEEEDTNIENQHRYEGIEGLEDYLEDDDSTTELQQIHQSLLRAINHLYQMSMVIRQPAHHDRLTGTRRADVEPFISRAKQHVSNKYPHLDEVLIDRLSSTTARQRAILKYRERYSPNLSHGIGLEDEDLAMPSETLVNGVYEETDQLDDMASDDGASETSYNGTLSEGIDGNTKIPPMPEKGRGQNPFKCPYCFYTITVPDDQAWAQHILRDLMPYVCVFPNCSSPNRLYESCQQWYAHIQQTHPITDTSYQCTICNQEHLPSREFRQHVSGHLQELALFYLPQATPDQDEDPETRQEEGAQNLTAEQYQRLNSLEKAERKATEEMTKVRLKEGKSKMQPETEIALKEAAAEHREKLMRERTEQERQTQKEFKQLLLGMGYSEEEIEHIIKKKNSKKMDKPEKAEKVEKGKEEETKNTWIKVHRKHLLPETLVTYNLPWGWDDHDANYIIIKKWITEDFQEELFLHTRNIREAKVIARTFNPMTTPKANDCHKGDTLVLRRKSPSDRGVIEMSPRS